MTNYQAILLMGGSGNRFKASTNKALIKIGNDFLFNHSLKVFLSDDACDKVFLGVNKNDIDYLKEIVKSEKVVFVEGGVTRFETVKNCLKHATMNVVVHDSARPIITLDDLRIIVKQLDFYDSVCYYEKCTDTYRINSHGSVKNLDRRQMYKILTPQAFKTTTFKTILNTQDNPSITDEVSILLNHEYRIKHLEAVHSMPKLTYEQDYEYIDYLLTKNQYQKIGHSFDFHPFIDGDGFNLGGINIPFSKKLKGWSDGDPLIHSITEAIIGALALGDIGTLYPDNDPKYQGIHSNYFLQEAKRLLDENNYEIINIDSIVYLEKPNLKNYKPLMKENIGNILGIDSSMVNVKATTMEQKGLVGSGDGIGAETVILIRKINKPLN